jgi:hypothetical protein
MPYSISYDEGAGGVISTYSGDITPEEIFNSFIERFDDPARSATLRYSIGDFTNVTSLILTTPNVQTLAGRAQDLLGRQKDLLAAIVAPSDIAFGLGRMLQLYANQTESIRVFRTLADAKSWISGKSQGGAGG